MSIDNDIFPQQPIHPVDREHIDPKDYRPFEPDITKCDRCEEWYYDSSILEISDTNMKQSENICTDCCIFEIEEEIINTWGLKIKPIQLLNTLGEGIYSK